MTPYVLTFLDSAGKSLAQVGLCYSAGLDESNRDLGRLDVLPEARPEIAEDIGVLVARGARRGPKPPRGAPFGAAPAPR